MSNSISHSHLKWDLWMVAALVCVAAVLGIYPADRTVWFAGRRMGRAEGHPLRYPRRDLLLGALPLVRSVHWESYWRLEMQTSKSKIPARIHAILAREADKAVVFRRGPSSTLAV